jgi:tetratricopeptide (TPR) repeat protein
MNCRLVRIRTLAIGLVLLFVVLAGAQTARAKDTWTSVRSKNFFLVGNASEKEIRQVSNRLEQFRKVFALLFPRVNFTTPVPTTVIVFKSDSSYKPFKSNPNVAGYFQPGEDVNYITLTTERTSEEKPFGVIFHEYVHLLVDNTMGRTVPLWFNEGLAEYYSTFNIMDENRKAVLGNLVSNHVLYLRENKLVPLRTLFAVDYKSPYYNEGNKMNIFYAESWMLMHFLLQGNKQQRVPQLGRFIDLIGSNIAVEDAFQRAFQTSFEAFEKDFKSYIQGASYMATFVTFKEKLDFDSEMQTAAVTEAEAQAYLGDLLLHSHRLSDAESRLQQALALTPDLPMAQTSLGMVRARQGRFDEAKQYLQKAVAANSENYLAHYYYAFALSGLGVNGFQVISGYSTEAAEIMRAELKKAIKLRPDFPESYSLLGFVNLVRNEEVDESIALLKRALSPSRANQRMPFMLAQLYMRKEDYAGARQLLQPITRSSPDPQLRSEAQSLLDGITRIEEELAKFKAMEKEAAARGDDSPPLLVRRNGSNEQEETPVQAQLDTASLLAQALRKPREGETRVQGILADIECDAKGVTFKVRIADHLLKLHANNFDRMDITAFTPDAGSEITCGPRKPESPVVITYVPAKDSRKIDGEASALEFVPKDFVLKP